MRILNESGKSSRDTFNSAQRTAFERFEIPIELWVEAKTWHDVRIKVSDLMMPHIRGRVTPVKERLGSNSKESTRLQQKSLFHDIIYPRKMKRESHKKKLLKQKLISGELSKDLYIDLMEVLR